MDVWSAPFLRDEEAARAYLEKKLWPDGPICPRCGATGTKIGKLRGRTTRPGLLKCYGCREPFTVTIGTVFEASHIPLHHWFRTICLLAAPSVAVPAPDEMTEADFRESLRIPRKRCTVSDLQAVLGIARNTAWKIREEISECLERNSLGIPERPQNRAAVSPTRKPPPRRRRSEPSQHRNQVTPDPGELFASQQDRTAAQPPQRKARAKRKPSSGTGAVQLDFPFDDDA
jgi:hypothetical protein